MEPKNTKNYPATANRLAAMFAAWRSCDSAYLQLVRQWGISLSTVWALEYLVKHPEGVEPAVLADDTHMLRQTINAVLNDLQNRGYLSRDSHGTDRRRKVIHLTPTGQVFAQTVLEVISLAEQEAASVLSDEEQQRLLDYSQRFAASFAKRVSSIILHKQ